MANTRSQVDDESLMVFAVAPSPPITALGVGSPRMNNRRFPSAKVGKLSLRFRQWNGYGMEQSIDKNRTEIRDSVASERSISSGVSCPPLETLAT